MLSKADVFVFIGIAISFVLAVFLWWSGDREHGLFAALWVPTLLCFGIYFKLLCQKNSNDGG